MESLFNIVWALVAMTSVCYWLKRGQHTPKGRQSSLVGLAMLVVILFPVISVSDDLWSLQNPAETDTCQRRDHMDRCFHQHFSATAALPEPPHAELQFWSRRVGAPRSVELIANASPAFGYIENRPPPVF
jgi:hypothetical protein